MTEKKWGALAIAIGLITGVLAVVTKQYFLLIPAIIIAVYGMFRVLSKKSGQDEEIVSIAAFFTELPFLDDSVLRHHVQKAWGVELSNDEDATEFVAGEAPLFIAKVGEEMYLINYFDQPYFDNLDEILDESVELRVKHSLENHKAWASVDRLGVDETTDVEDAYRKIGKLLYEIVNEDCTAICIPSQMNIVPWSAETEEVLLSDNPMAELCPTNPPVVQIAPDDPRLQAAVEQARNSFSQFEEAFATRQPDLQFSVKSPIEHNGNTEFIWVAVSGIENNIIYGELANEPVDLGDRKMGDRVRVDARKINDWIYETNDGIEGGFTVKVVAAIADENSGGK